MVKWKVRSTRFVDELRARAQSFSGRKITMKIVVPSELRWWYWLEFGTAAHPIDPHKPPMALRWFDPRGNPVLREHVNHPGIRPRGFVRKALPEIHQDSLRMIYAALTQEGFRYGPVKAAVENEIAQHALDKVIDSLAAETKHEPRTTPGAKLPGQTAAEAFRNLATVETTTT